MKPQVIQIFLFLLLSIGPIFSQFSDLSIVLQEWQYLTNQLSDGRYCSLDQSDTTAERCSIVFTILVGYPGFVDYFELTYTIGPLICIVCSITRNYYQMNYRVHANRRFVIRARASDVPNFDIDRWIEEDQVYANRIYGGSLLLGEIRNARLTYYIAVKCYGMYGPNCLTRCNADPLVSLCDDRTGLRVCIENKFGPNCDLSSHPCLSNVCPDFQICIPNGLEFICMCNGADINASCFSGRCTITNCARGLCSISRCHCTDGYTGENCDIRVCTDSVCNGLGLCSISGNTVKCDCRSEIAAGSFCEFPCQSTCLNNGVCTVHNNFAVCDCPNGFTGTDCRIRITSSDSCVNMPCLNGGRCSLNPSISDNYICDCLGPWTGTNCQFNQCNSYNCLNGNCADGIGCICLEGYFGSDCSTPTCIDNNMCQNRGQCVLAIDRPICECNSAFFTGQFCQLSCPLRCSQNGVCSLINNVLGCRCRENFTGDSCEIELIDACNPNPCKNGGECTLHDMGQFSCRCTASWTGDTCEIDTCNIGNCEFGVCLENIGCICTEFNSGPTCGIVECENYDKCQNGGLCIPKGIRPGCLCDSGRSTGNFCEFRCPHLCIHGECGFKDGFLACLCESNFYGPSCSTNREFLNLELQAVGMIIGILILINIIIVIIKLMKDYRKKLIKRAFDNATFDPSNVLNLKETVREIETSDTYAFLGSATK